VFGDGGEQGREVRRFAECAGANGVEDCREIRVEFEAAIEMPVPDIFDVLGQVTEEEDVLFADFAGYFDLLRGGGG